MIHRYSSRQGQKLGEQFLARKLRDAQSYDRIAGYFSSSILEIAGEQIGNMEGPVRMICNSDLDPMDVQAANAAALAITQEWKKSIDSLYSETLQARLSALHQLLKSNKLQVRVLPNEAFGLIHGKAGVITFRDGTQTSFLGSANESKSAWALNYELIWEDDSPEAVAWVQAEFDILWKDARAIPLSEAVIQDIERLGKRTVVSHESWKKGTAQPEAAVVESPIYRQHYGLWAHQKYFVKKAYEEHVSGRGARFVLADQVGLGKTVQLALAAMLMALKGDKPVLIIAPKTLLYQWQDEMMKLLDLPSAVWDGKAWIDENEIRHENNDPEKAIQNCPRRFGIISQGLIVRGNDITRQLLHLRYECVIVDEAHRSRRSNLKAGGENEKAEPNKLMQFLLSLSKCTHSMMLGTATPVQLYPIEAYDLLSVLGAGSPHVLGDPYSKWNSGKKDIAFQLVEGTAKINTDRAMKWDWIRNPFPPAEEDDSVFGVIRRDLDMKPTDYLIKMEEEENLRPWNRSIMDNRDDLFVKHNPYIRHIIRRTRKYLEETLNPETHEPYLQPIGVKLYGEGVRDAILLPGYLQDAYETAESFCTALGKQMQGAGFIRTLLLRRIGSSLEAGRKTAEKMLGQGGLSQEWEEDDDTEEEEKSGIARRLGENEQQLLRKLIYELDQYQKQDPKLDRLQQLLFEEGWADAGCIIFSQYFDTVKYFSLQVAKARPELEIGVYAGSDKSGIWQKGIFTRYSKEEVKARVQRGELKILFGTDSASEGLNLQRLGTLINLDLPWNPTRLEQRKGRIQRIGQRHREVRIYNMRYAGSVEDRVHELLSERLEKIYNLFGQIPDILQDVWIEAAQGEIEKARERIRQVETRSAFEIRYDRPIENVDFETCTEVLNGEEIGAALRRGW
ncbi:MAG: phospholipase D-like domain-containing anti-phage protein [Bacteroidia bacterium]|nr:phospholipase D-like domain-containing anti-phage protein [Bacteroidia bacterium]